MAFLRKFCHLLLTLIVTLFCSLAQAKIVKWVDDAGVTHYGDQLPTQYAGKSSSEISVRGVVIKQNKVVDKIKEYQIEYRVKNKEKLDKKKEESKAKTLLYKEAVRKMKLEDFLRKSELKIQKKIETAIRRKEKEHLRYINRKKLKGDDNILLK